MAIKVDELFGMINDHMGEQPYHCVCAKCGAPVELDIEIDKELDMGIRVPVCDCAKEDKEDE